MSVTVFHNLTATTPDDPSAEIRPSHWNSSHAVSLSLYGTDIIGAFSNDPAVNVSFGTNLGGYVTASANVTAAPSPVNVTGANGFSVNAQTIAFSNANGISLGIATGANGATVTGSYTVPNVPAQSAFVFSNSNGITFGTNVSTVTASFSAPPAQTVQPVAFSASGGSSNFSTLVFSNGSGVTFSNSNGSVMATVATNYQSQGAYLTTARASNDAVGLNTAQSNVTWTVNSSGLSLDARGYAGTGFSGTNASATLNSNGLQLSVGAGGGGGFTGGVSTGGNAVGNTGTQTGQIVFAGGNNITLSVGTAAGGAQTITISGANAGGAQTGISGIVAGTQTQTSGTLSFANSNGISFGLSNSSVLTASYTVPSTAGLISAINFSAGTTSGNLSALTFANSNGITFGLNASTVTASFSAPPAQTVQPVAVSGSNGSFAFSTLTMGNLNGLTHYTSNGSLVASYTVPSQTTQPVAFSAANGSALFSTISFSNVNGVSFATAAGPAIQASIATTYAGTGVTTTTQAGSTMGLTLNTSGLSVAVPAWLTAAAGGGGIAADIGGNSTSAGGGYATITSGTMFLAGGPNITLSQNGQSISISANAPGAAAENNWMNLLGANTAGNTTASGSTLGFSGINLTLSGTNNSVINISAPATSSIVGINGISLSTNGSTISISAQQYSASWFQPEVYGNSMTSSHANGTVYLRPFELQGYYDVDKFMFQQSYSSSASTYSFSASVSAGSASSGSGSWGQSGTLYMMSRLSTNEADANYLSIQSFDSKTYSQSAGYSVSVSWSTNVSSATASWTTSGAIGWIQKIDGAGGITSSSSGTSGSSTFSSTSTNANSFSSSYIMSFPYAHYSGFRPQYVPGSGTQVPPGFYWLAMVQSTSTGSTNYSLQRVAMLSSPGLLYFTATTNNYMEIGNSVAITSSNWRPGFGSYSASSNMTTAIPLTAISAMASNASIYFALDGNTK